MEKQNVDHLIKELKLKKIQFNSIYEFSSSLYSSFEIENIIRIFFSTIMGQMAIPKIFFFDSQKKLFREKGCRFSAPEFDLLKKSANKLNYNWFYLEIEKLSADFTRLKDLLTKKNIYYLVNVSDSKKKKILLGLGCKFNKVKLSSEEIEFAFFISRFSLIAIDNAILINRIIENKRIEHELKIAKDIQLSLLPQSVPELNNFEIAVIYEPINEVGGDYYDIFDEKKGMIPVLIADVEGKGLPAALLAASSQAVFQSLNELYFQQPAKFMAKANQLIYNFTRGNRFITLFWMRINDNHKSISYVNAGHIEPFLIRKNNVTQLSKGGFLTGFIEETEYEMGVVKLKRGDVLVAFTDGVPEVENPEGEEFGIEAMISFIMKKQNLSAQGIIDTFYKKIISFSKGKKFRDDFTLIVLKVKE